MKNLILGGIATISIAVAALFAAAPALADCGSVGPTCDAVPKVDGIYRVSDGSFFSTGIMAGKITTNGPLAGWGGSNKRCVWSRLSGTTSTIDNTIETGAVELGEGPAIVTIEPTDVAFYSTGCQPWHRA